MKTSRRILSVLMSVSLLLSLFVGTMAFSAAAETVNGGIVSFRSPAILANVGDKIDLSKYGVEFAEGVATTEGLTWWKESVSGLSVPYTNPALFANVGDAINFTDYDVELTKGNTVKAENLTWTQNVTQKVIPAATPYLQAEAGETVDLKYWSVEGMGANLSWKLDDKVVSTITAKAGDVLTVTDGTATKDVIVATKDGNNYVVYENDFNEASDIDGVSRAPFGGSADQVRFSVSDGAFHFVRASSYSSGQENAAIVLPTYLWELSDYTIEWKASVIDYIKKGTSSTSQAGTTGIGLFINGDTTIGRPNHFMLFTRANKLKLYTRTDAAKYADSLTLGKEASVMSNFSKATWVAFKVKIENGTNATFYYDYDTEADPKGPSGTYSKIHTYDFAAVEGQTHFATKGAMGFTIYHGDWDLDDIKITVPAVAYTTKAAAVPAVAYTPAEKGVSVFTVTDGVNAHTVCVIAKNAEDTEYVLYENDFEDEGDFEELVRTTVFGADATLYPYSLVDLDGNKVFSTDRDYSSSTSSQQNASVALPEYLSNFSDYTIEWKGSVTDYTDARDGSTNSTFTGTAAMSFFLNGDMTEGAWAHHLVQYSRSNSLYFYTRAYSEDNKYANQLLYEKKYSSVMPNFSKETWVGFKVEVAGGTKVTAYYDYDSTNKTYTGEYTKVRDYNFATVSGQTHLDTTGVMGFSFYRSDWNLDDIKITIEGAALEPTVELKAVTSFTPVEAGVTPITVKCGDVEKTIYIVAKNAADTEYVLYENNFDSEDDVNDLTVVQGDADMTVANGQLTIDGKTSIGSDSDDGAYIRLPEWLGEFGDYEISAKIVRDTYKTSSEALGFFARSANANDAESLYLVRSRFTNNVSDCIAYAQRIPGIAKPRSLSWGLRKNTSIHNAASGLYNIVKMGVAGDTVTMQIIDQDEDGRADDNYVLYATEQKELRTGYIGLFITEVVVHYDYIRVTVPATPEAPTAATFTADADLAEGTIAGKLDVTLPGTGVEPSDVIFYWGDGEGKLAGYAGFEKILVVNNATEVSYTIPAGTVVPAGATELRVYAMNLAGESTDCVVVPLEGIAAKGGEKLFSFGVNSDWHIAAAFSASTGNPTYSTANNDAHFIQMIERMKAADPSATQIFFGGDIVDGQKGAEAEYARLLELMETYAQGYTFDGILGNHEYWFTNEEQAAGNDTYEYTINNFANYMNIPITPEKPYYSKDFNGYQFFFLNTIERDGTSKQSHNDATLGTEQLEWLDAGLAAATANGKVAFVFHHQPIGDQIVDKAALVAVLKKYPTAIFVSSHSHDELQQQSTFALADDAMCNTVDTSAVTFVIPAHYNKGTENVRNMSEGYLVEMYADRVVFRGMDFMTGEWLPSATFAFAYEAGQQPNTAVVEDKTITVKADEGYELKAGSLIVVDANGDRFVPTRVGFRNDGDATQYQIPENAVAPYTVEYEFYEPDMDNINAGFLGTSVNEVKSGLRFVHRLNVAKDGDKLYMTIGGEKKEVAKYGLLVAAQAVVQNPEKLTLKVAAESMHVHQIDWPVANKYYDTCVDFSDISVQVTGIADANAQNVAFITRSYVEFADGTVAYADPVANSYNEHYRVYETATMADLEADDAVVYIGRSTADGTTRRIASNYGASGIVISGQLEGNIYLSVSHTAYAGRINVVIDGKLTDSILVEGDATLKIASNLMPGNHTVQITRGNSNYGVLVLKDISFCGTLGTPTVNPLQIEVIGDSITAAGGGDFDYGDGSDLAKSKAHNTYLGYAAQTARALGADLSIIAKSGAKVADRQEKFNELDYSGADKDIVVINLGTNDFGYPHHDAPTAALAETCKSFIDDIRATYGEDTYVIWAYGMMFDKDKDFLADMIAEYCAETGADNVFFCDLSAAKNNDGNTQHPNQAGHDAAAELLTAFIRANCDLG